MKKIWKNTGTIRGIKNIALSFAQQWAWFELLKSKVSPRQKLMIAVSGGADSILTACLMYNFFIKSKYDLQNLFFIHCNHWVRPGNTADEEFIKKFFKDTQLIIVKRKKGTTDKDTEAQLRNRRYEEFRKQAKKHHIDQFVFGHNLTDRIESTFLNLLRGANSNGFLAMQTQETHHLLWWIEVIRPILWLSKDEIFTICKQNNIPFVTDPTNNDSTTSLRNKLRNKVLPELYKLSHKHTSTTNTFIESMKNIYEQYEQTTQQEKNILNSISQSPHRHATFAYQRKIAPKEITNEWLLQVMKTLNISNNITTPLLNERKKFLQNNKSGYKYFNKTYVFKSHGNMYFISAPKWFWEKQIEKSKTITMLGQVKRYELTLPITKKEQIGASLRFAKTTDRYHNKSWNQYCITAKIPVFWRNFIPVLVKEGKIINVWKEHI